MCVHFTFKEKQQQQQIQFDRFWYFFVQSIWRRHHFSFFFPIKTSQVEQVGEVTLVMINQVHRSVRSRHLPTFEYRLWSNKKLKYQAVHWHKISSLEWNGILRIGGNVPFWTQKVCISAGSTQKFYIHQDCSQFFNDQLLYYSKVQLLSGDNQSLSWSSYDLENLFLSCGKEKLVCEKSNQNWVWGIQRVSKIEFLFKSDLTNDESIIKIYSFSFSPSFIIHFFPSKRFITCIVFLLPNFFFSI